MSRFTRSSIAGLLAALAAMLCACEETVVSKTVVDSDGIATVPAGERLLKADCNDSTIGDFVYVEDSLLIYHCTDWGWRAYTGRNGKNGKDGPAGKDGADGEDGENGKNGFNCSIDSFNEGFTVVCGTSLAKIEFQAYLPDTCAISSEDSKGFKVTCGKDSVMQKAGADGRAGIGCTMRDLGTGEYDFICQGDTAKVYAAQCGGKPYDPLQGYCVLDTVRTPEEYKKYKACWDKNTDWTNHFCDTRDGNVYAFVEIGGQVWMGQNLGYADSVSTPSLIKGTQCFGYNLGCTYTWGAAIDSIALARDPDNPSTCGNVKNPQVDQCHMPHLVRGICPHGWHLPNTNDFALLKNAMLPTPNTLAHELESYNYWTTEYNGNMAKTYTVKDGAWVQVLYAKNTPGAVRCVKDGN